MIRMDNVRNEDMRNRLELRQKRQIQCFGFILNMFGHVIRMTEDWVNNMVHDWDEDNRRGQGRPYSRWLGEVNTACHPRPFELRDICQ